MCSVCQETNTQYVDTTALTAFGPEGLYGQEPTLKPRLHSSGGGGGGQAGHSPVDVDEVTGSGEGGTGANASVSPSPPNEHLCDKRCRGKQGGLLDMGRGRHIPTAPEFHQSCPHGERGLHRRTGVSQASQATHQTIGPEAKLAPGHKQTSSCSATKGSAHLPPPREVVTRGVSEHVSG